MTDPRAPSRPTERLAVATLDHHLTSLGYVAVPDPRPPGGGWRRLYMGGGPSDAVVAVLSATGPAEGAWCSLGVELPARRTTLGERAEALVHALAPYEVALDLDVSDGRPSTDAIVRVALRVFVEGLCSAVVRDVVDNLAEATFVARRVLDA